LNKPRFLTGHRPARTRAAVAVLGICVGLTTVLAGAASAQTAPSPKPPSLATIPGCGGAITTTTDGNPTTLPVGQTSVVTVRASRDVGPTPCFINVFDTTTNPPVLLRTCGFGTICSVSVTKFQPQTRVYRGNISTSFNPNNVLPGSESNSAYVTWNNVWSLRLTANPMPFTFGSTTLTATANRDVGPTPFFIFIFREDGPNHTAGTLLNRCAFGTSCAATDFPSLSPGTDYVAFVAPFSFGAPPLGSIVASSNIVHVTRLFIFGASQQPTPSPSPVPDVRK
jgi:hypothetical protein